MSTTRNILPGVFFGKSLYIYLALVISLPLYLMIHSYVQAIDVHEDEAVAAAATACFMAGIFAGRYIAQFWSPGYQSLRTGRVILLVTSIIVCISWLFFHADFPLQRRAAINLLLFWLPFMVVSLALGMLVKMISSNNQYQLREAQASAATSKSELHLLQSQLSPHFLFNTLNNLYGLSISQHEKIPGLLLKLSELLRYSVYEANEIYVPLKDELSYISNYINFETIRIGDRLVLTVELENIQRTDIRIAPMLLIVFIENAFKHSKNTPEQQIFIEIVVRTWGTSILFSVKNSFSKTEETALVDKSSGLGLASVRKRLELLYPGAYELTIHDEEPLYTVLLQLKLK